MKDKDKSCPSLYLTILLVVVLVAGISAAASTTTMTKTSTMAMTMNFWKELGMYVLCSNLSSNLVEDAHPIGVEEDILYSLVRIFYS